MGQHAEQAPLGTFRILDKNRRGPDELGRGDRTTR
jgi:hypothetical protein